MAGCASAPHMSDIGGKAGVAFCAAKCRNGLKVLVAFGDVLYIRETSGKMKVVRL